MNEDNTGCNEIELVITAPEKYGSQLAWLGGARITVGVLTQLVARAESRVTIAFPFVSMGNATTGVFADAVREAVKRSVEVSVFSTSAGVASFRRRFADPDWTEDPIRYFRPQANIESEQDTLGSHAKVLIADGEKAYLGSANLTYTGLGGNLELGVLVEGRIARQVDAFWDHLIRIGFFKPVEPSRSNEPL